MTLSVRAGLAGGVGRAGGGCAVSAWTCAHSEGLAISRGAALLEHGRLSLRLVHSLEGRRAIPHPLVCVLAGMNYRPDAYSRDMHFIRICLEP